MKVEKLLVTVEETTSYTFEVSPETGFDTFPDNVEELVKYIQQIKDSPQDFCNIDEEPDHELITNQGFITTRKVVNVA